MPRSYSAPLNTSIYLGRYHEGLSPNVITPLPYRRVQKQAPIRDEFVAEVDRSIEEDIDQRSGDGEAPPPDVSRMPSFYRYAFKKNMIWFRFFALRFWDKNLKIWS